MSWAGNGDRRCVRDETTWSIGQQITAKGRRLCHFLLESEILAVADVVEAMGSYRPYRPSLGIEKALGEIAANRGILYDPEAVCCCLWLFREKGFALG